MAACSWMVQAIRRADQRSRAALPRHRGNRQGVLSQTRLHQVAAPRHDADAAARDTFAALTLSSPKFQTLFHRPMLANQMTPEDFVRAVRISCIDDVVKDCVGSYVAPPGRKPHSTLLRLSAWFNALSSADQAMVSEAMRDSAEAAVFGVFCIIDGVRAVDSGSGKFEFRLTAQQSGQESLLSPSNTYLHDLLRSDA